MPAGNRAVTGKYVGQTTAWLADKLTKLETAYDAALLNQSYSRPGFSFQKANLESIATEMAEVQYAQRVASGDAIRTSYVDLDT